MFELIGLPKSSEDLHSLIKKAERSKKYVWTPGRVVIEAAAQTQLADIGWEKRKAVLRRLHDLLEDLVNQGILERRKLRQSIGFGQEIAFDYVHDPSSAPELNLR